MTGRDTYHHGSLRGALVDTSLELARGGGPDAVVLREAARRLGVSPTAAYRHFRDRDDLLRAVRVRALAALAAAMTAASRPVGGPAQEQALRHFRAMGEGYVAFALAEPGLFRTLGAAPASLDGLEPAEDPFALLADALDRLVEVGVLPTAARRRADAVAWAAVHGLSVLLLDGSLPREEADPLLARVLEVVAFGLLPR